MHYLQLYRFVIKFLLSGCQFDNCYFTNDINHFGNDMTKKFDAIIFDMPIQMLDEVFIAITN